MRRYGVCTSLKPKVNHLQIFDIVYYDVIMYRKLLFIGYANARKEYRFVDLYRNEVLVSKYVSYVARFIELQP
jgi:hypothetical protein